MYRNFGAKNILMFVFVGVVPAFAKSPSWFSENILKKNERILEVSCSGQGPDKSVASKVGMDQCRGISLQYIEGYTLRTRSLSIEDNHQASWHNESSSENIVTGLDCEPLKQECQEQDTSWTCYLLCRFNLATAKVTQPIKTKSNDDRNEAEPSELVSKKDLATTLPANGSVLEKPSLIQSENQHLLISTVPSPCDDILVIGRSRTIKCDGNPKAIIIFPEDREVIIRLKGYKPKHLDLEKNRKPVKFNPIETVDVYLEKL